MNNLKGNAKTDKRKSYRGSVWACPLAYLFDVMAAERCIANNECASHGLTLTARHDAHVRAVVGWGWGAVRVADSPKPTPMRLCESRRREGRKKKKSSSSSRRD